MSISGDKDIDKKDLTRLVSQYKIGNFRIGLMYQDTDDNVDLNNETGYFGSLSYKSSSKTTIKVQLVRLMATLMMRTHFQSGLTISLLKTQRFLLFIHKMKTLCLIQRKMSFLLWV